MVGRRGFSESPIFVPFYAGFRVAAAIPSPSMCSLVAGVILVSMIRRRRGENSARSCCVATPKRVASIRRLDPMRIFSPCLSTQEAPGHTPGAPCLGKSVSCRCLCSLC
jgi:hypothetical protein